MPFSDLTPTHLVISKIVYHTGEGKKNNIYPARGERKKRRTLDLNRYKLTTTTKKIKQNGAERTAGKV